MTKVKISLRFVSWLDILDILIGSIPYILLKLEEIKRVRQYLCDNILRELFRHKMLSPFFTLKIKSIGILSLSQRTKFRSLQT